MNDFGTLAYKIVKYEFADDVSRFPISYVSGWLETNLGELNGLTHEDFYIDASGNIGPSGLEPVEEKIYSYLYEINYYNKASRDALRGFIWAGSSGIADDWTSIKEGDSSVQRVSKNSLSRTFLDLSSQAQQKLDNLIYQYNNQKSSPIQVAGEDGNQIVYGADYSSIRGY
jgi:hypothetical protein